MIPLSMNTILSRAMRMLYSCPSRCNYRLSNLADHLITALRSQTLAGESSFYILPSSPEMRRSSTYFTFGLLSIPTNRPDRDIPTSTTCTWERTCFTLTRQITWYADAFPRFILYFCYEVRISIGLNTKTQLANSIPSPFIQLDRHNPSSATLGFRSAANM
jgi:hypothetical protein